jgi:mRNA interferase MazF
LERFASDDGPSYLFIGWDVTTGKGAMWTTILVLLVLVGLLNKITRFLRGNVILMQKEVGEKEIINDLNENEIHKLNICLNNLKNTISKEKHIDALRYCNWVNEKLNIHLLANRQEKERSKHEKRHHPIRPRRGEIYLTQLGQNIGKEINGKHLVIVMQNNKANIFSNTVVVIPISGSGKLYDGHEKIEARDLKVGRLDKLPSKAKTEQIQFLDKARMIHKVGELTEQAMKRISTRLRKILDV